MTDGAYKIDGEAKQTKQIPAELKPDRRKNKNKTAPSKPSKSREARRSNTPMTKHCTCVHRKITGKLTMSMAITRRSTTAIGQNGKLDIIATTYRQCHLPRSQLITTLRVRDLSYDDLQSQNTI